MRRILFIALLVIAIVASIVLIFLLIRTLPPLTMPNATTYPNSPNTSSAPPVSPYGSYTGTITDILPKTDGSTNATLKTTTNTITLDIPTTATIISPNDRTLTPSQVQKGMTVVAKGTRTGNTLEVKTLLIE